ncbi:MAG: hypothetical protein RMI74_08130 [Thermodesulfobacterium sp.]|nr:hypothetical protein [Thermodesulfobacterium sp.]
MKLLRFWEKLWVRMIGMGGLRTEGKPPCGALDLKDMYNKLKNGRRRLKEF